jgi:hypothetical protein
MKSDREEVRKERSGKKKKGNEGRNGGNEKKMNQLMTQITPILSIIT